MAKIDEFEFFLQKEWSDGLPVVTPTEERVATFLWLARGLGLVLLERKYILYSVC